MKPRICLVAGLAFATVVSAQTPIALPAFTSTYTASQTRGFWFQAPIACVITGLEVPNEAVQPFQVLEVLDLGTTPPPAFPASVNPTAQLFYDNSTASGIQVATTIVLQAGNYYGILGACNNAQGSATSYNSYGAGPFTSNILGNPTLLTRFITQSGIASNGGNQPVSSAGGSLARVFVDIAPAMGVFANFSSDVTTGASPLTVNFQDTSFSNPNPITSWAWDFDNDGTVDSTAQNPTHVYTACGTYDVSLTVDDGVNPPETETKIAYISTDSVEASFNESLLAPLVMQFTDTSTGPATMWNWDLDGDGTVDSTVQNPAFAYPNTNPVTVTLTASRLCGAPDTTSKTIVPAQQITTTFANNNSGGAGWAMFFDMDVVNGSGISITGFDVNSNTAAAAPATLDVYLGSPILANVPASATAMNPDDWTFVGQATGTTAGVGLPTNVTLAAAIYVPPGEYGVCLHHVDMAPAYTNGNGANQAYSNGDIALDLGFSRGSTAADPFASATTFDPRIWNGTIYYETCAFTGAAGYGYAGQGCAGTLGVPTLTPNGAPQLGTTFTVDVGNLPIDVAIMITGLNNTTSNLGPLPFDGAAVGAPGCFLRTSDDTTLLLLGAGNTATWTLNIPNDPGLTCVKYYQQAIVLDPGVNPAGATISNAGSLIMGN